MPICLGQVSMHSFTSKGQTHSGKATPGQTWSVKVRLGDGRSHQVRHSGEVALSQTLSSEVTRGQRRKSGEITQGQTRSREVIRTETWTGELIWVSDRECRGRTMSDSVEVVRGQPGEPRSREIR